MKGKELLHNNPRAMDNNTIILPHDHDIEQAVLGAICLESQSCVGVLGLISEETFHNPKHRTIYKAIESLFRSGSPIDIMTVTQELRTLGLIEEAGGAFGVTQMTNRVNQAGNVEYYSRILLQYQIRRKTILVSEDTKKKALDLSNDIFEVVDGLEEQINDAIGGGISGKVYSSASVIKQLRENLANTSSGESQIEYISFGIPRVDQILRARVGQYIIIAARPSMGKSALAGMLAYHNALEGKATLVYCRETSKEVFITRMVCYVASVTFEEFEKGMLDEAAQNRVSAAFEEIAAIPLFIEETSGQSAQQIVSLAKRMKIQHDLKLVIGDYIQLATDPKNKGNRNEEVASISRAFHNASSNLKVAWVELSQLSRKIEDRTDKKPQLSDLRESGQIEQDAKIVVGLYRDWYYGIEEDEEGESTEYQADLCFLKNKNGESGTVMKVGADMKYFSFHQL